MLLVYPFQVALAMADGCCVATPAGITHHSTGQDNSPAVAEPVFLADDARSTLADPHCPACVFGQIPGIPSNVAAMPAVAHHVAAIAFDIPFLTSVPGSRPERPNWPAAAK
ncbi:MAG: hypothetical protein JWP72_4402 [Massilia sp.]|nr:hypothetical protein [Massilia sp.]